MKGGGAQKKVVICDNNRRDICKSLGSDTYEFIVHVTHGNLRAVAIDSDRNTRKVTRPKTFGHPTVENLRPRKENAQSQIAILQYSAKP